MLRAASGQATRLVDLQVTFGRGAAGPEQAVAPLPASVQASSSVTAQHYR
jgi:hypothetical protein